jgi:hypothetical protein
MDARESLRRNFDGDPGSFLLRARCDLTWDRDAFHELTRSMFAIASETRESGTLERWVAEGFWFCDTWIASWTSHPSFTRPPQHEEALELIHDLAYYYFVGESPYEDDRLERMADGELEQS